MKLSIFQRTAKKKSDITKIRREGNVPGVLYGVGHTPQNIALKNADMQAILRKLPSQLLSTTVFELADESGQTHRAIVKEVQYHPTSYAILHMDFAIVSDKVPFSVNVPIQLQGIDNCVGVKQGGFVRAVIRSLKVKCLLQDLPRELKIDVTEMNIAQSKRLSDISLPVGVTPLAKMNEIAVVIAKKA